MRKHFSLFHAITSSIGRKKSHFVDNTLEEMGKWTERKNADSCRPLILTSIYIATTTSTTDIQFTTLRKVTVADTESYPDIIETNTNVFGFKSKCLFKCLCLMWMYIIQCRSSTAYWNVCQPIYCTIKWEKDYILTEQEKWNTRTKYMHIRDEKKS